MQADGKKGKPLRPSHSIETRWMLWLRNNVALEITFSDICHDINDSSCVQYLLNQKQKLILQVLDN